MLVMLTWLATSMLWLPLFLRPFTCNHDSTGVCSKHSQPVGNDDAPDNPKEVEHQHPFKAAFVALMQKGGLPTNESSLMDLWLRTYYGSKEMLALEGMLLPSLELFWNQADLGDVVIVFDQADQGNVELETRIVQWKLRIRRLKVFYMADDLIPPLAVEVKIKYGYFSAMYSNLLADLHATAPLIGLIATDVLFIMPPLPSLFLDSSGRPHHVVFTGYRHSVWWDKQMPEGTERFLGVRQQGTFNMNFPMVFRRDTFEHVRQRISYVAGGLPFQQAMAKHMSIAENAYRFADGAILGTYAMHFENEIYSFSFQRQSSGNNLFPVPSDPASLRPLPRAAIHAKYATHASPREHLIAGYCAVHELDDMVPDPFCDEGRWSSAHWEKHIWIFDNLGPWPDHGTDSRRKQVELLRSSLQKLRWRFNEPHARHRVGQTLNACTYNKNAAGQLG